MVGAEEAGGEFFHKGLEGEEDGDARGGDDDHNDKVFRGEEDEFEEVADKGDGESGGHDTDDS